MVASDVTAEAAVLLTDATQASWSNTVLIPCLAKANRELETLLEANSIPWLKKKASPVTSVEIGDTQLDDYPVDYVECISLWERALGSSERWVKVREVDNIDPNNSTSSQVIEWCNQGGLILINPPTSDREIYMDYRRTLTPILVAGSTIEIASAITWLAARTAQIAAKDIGNSPTKADGLQADVDKAEDMLIRRLVKSIQGVGGARRRPYRGARMKHRLVT